jgi:hypothetical protein
VIRTRQPTPSPEQFVPTNGDVGFYGKPPAPQPPPLTAPSSANVDLVYGSEEQAVLINLRTRVNELEARLRTLGLLP